jgi:hypothetical protein
MLVAAGLSARAQEAPKPTKEHAALKQAEGVWDATVKFGNDESKGEYIAKMDSSGLWLITTFKGTFGGQMFEGHGIDGYDPEKKKFVGVWADSMAPSLMTTLGTYDEKTKTLTMEGTGPSPSGPTKMRMVSKFVDKDTIDWAMYTGDSKDPMFTIKYKRRK